MEFSLMCRRMLYMVYHVNILLFKDIFGIPKNYLDKQMYYMLDEYSFYYDLYKESREK